MLCQFWPKSLKSSCSNIYNQPKVKHVIVNQLRNTWTYAKYIVVTHCRCDSLAFYGRIYGYNPQKQSSGIKLSGKDYKPRNADFDFGRMYGRLDVEISYRFLGAKNIQWNVGRNTDTKYLLPVHGQHFWSRLLARIRAGWLLGNPKLSKNHADDNNAVGKILPVWFSHFVKWWMTIDSNSACSQNSEPLEKSRQRRKLHPRKLVLCPFTVAISEKWRPTMYMHSVNPAQPKMSEGHLPDVASAVRKLLPVYVSQLGKWSPHSDSSLLNPKIVRTPRINAAVMPNAYRNP